MPRKSVTQSTHAARAEAIFKPVAKAAAPMDELAAEKKAFDENRERLKAERLAREASAKHKPR